MQTKLIQTKEYLLLIDEEAEIKEYFKGYIYQPHWKEPVELEDNFISLGYAEEDRKEFGGGKIIAYYPLTKEAKELDLPLLPPFRHDNIEELAEKWYIDNIETSNSSYNDTNSFIAGYKAAQSKQFSLEDMKKAIEMARDNSDGKDTFTGEDISGLTEVCTYDWVQTYSDEEIIQSLSTQQLPKEFIPEYEYLKCLECEGAGWMLSCSKCKGEGNEKTSKLKTITNSEGKQVLVGNYKY